MSGWIAGAVVGVGAVSAGLNYFGNQQASEAAQNSANQQLGFAQSSRAQGMNFAAATPQELNILGQQYGAASQQLQQQQQLMSSIDPALMSASKQALTILQGGTASVNNPLMMQRNAQRSQLVNSLQSQYGPGAESTSIGQRALSQFDMQTNTMFQQNQMSSLNQLQGIANSGGNTGGVNSAYSNLAAVGQGYGAIQNRQVAASEGTASPVYNSAGAGSVGSGLQGQGLAALGNNIGQSGMTLGMMYGMKGMGGGSGGGYDPTAGFSPSTGGGGTNMFNGANPYST